MAEPPAPQPNGGHPEKAPQAASGPVGNAAGAPGLPNFITQRPAAPTPPRPAPDPAAASHSSGDHRRTLHLALGNPSHLNGGSHSGDGPLERPHTPNGGHQTQTGLATPVPAGDGAALNGFSEVRSAAYDPIRPADAATPARKAGGAFIDHELRARVDSDIAVFLAAFDAALQQDSQESRSALREATDRLLRAGARTRIELERLEARMPLLRRDDGDRGDSAWRNR